MHSGIFHNEDSVIFPCDHCDYKANKKGNLLRHIKSMHEGVKFSCDQCDYRATLKGSLLKRIKAIHEGVKFPCGQCDYKATLKRNLLIQNQYMKESSSLVINVILG